MTQHPTTPQDAADLPHELLASLLGNSTHAVEPQDPAIDRVWQRIQVGLTAPVANPSLMLNEQAHEGRWRAFGPGIDSKTLLRQGSDVSVMLRMQPGAVLPSHWHAADEHCIVVSGRLRLAGSGIHIEAGGFHWVAAHTQHEEIVAEVETLLYLRGALDEPQPS